MEQIYSEIHAMTILDVVNTIFIRSVGVLVWPIIGIGVLASGFLRFIANASVVIGLAIVVIVGPWDLLVWLTKSDWRTTNFAAPIAGAIAAVAGLMLKPTARALFEFCSEGLEWATLLLDWRAPNARKPDLQAILDTYKTRDDEK